MSQKAYHLYLFFRLCSLYFSIFGLFCFYIFLINNYKNTKNIFCVRKNISVRISSVTQYVTVSQWSEMQFITSMPAKSFWPDWNVWWKTTSIQERKKRNIPDDRVLQLGKQILEMLKSMVSSQQARFQFPIQPIVHGSWMDIWQIRESGRRDYCIGPGSSIILLSS